MINNIFVFAVFLMIGPVFGAEPSVIETDRWAGTLFRTENVSLVYQYAGPKDGANLAKTIGTTPAKRHQLTLAAMEIVGAEGEAFTKALSTCVYMLEKDLGLLFVDKETKKKRDIIDNLYWHPSPRTAFLMCLGDPKALYPFIKAESPPIYARLNDLVVFQGDLLACERQSFGLRRGEWGYTVDIPRFRSLNDFWAGEGVAVARIQQLGGLLSGESGYSQDMDSFRRLTEQYAREGLEQAQAYQLYGLENGVYGYVKNTTFATALRETYAKERALRGLSGGGGQCMTTVSWRSDDSTAQAILKLFGIHETPQDIPGASALIVTNRIYL